MGNHVNLNVEITAAPSGWTYPWPILGLSLVHLWPILGASLAYHWLIFVLSLAYLWPIIGPCLVGYILCHSLAYPIRYFNQRLINGLTKSCWVCSPNRNQDMAIKEIQKYEKEYTGLPSKDET